MRVLNTGHSVTEYALVGTLVTLVAVGAVTTVSNQLLEQFDRVSEEMFRVMPSGVSTATATQSGPGSESGEGDGLPSSPLDEPADTSSAQHDVETLGTYGNPPTAGPPVFNWGQEPAVDTADDSEVDNLESEEF